MSNFFNRFNQASGEVQQSSGGIIPGGTVALCAIIKAELYESEYGKYYRFSYKLLDGKYKGRLVFHKVKVFEEDAKKAERQMNMLKKIYNVCGVDMAVSQGFDYPQTIDLIGFVNKQVVVSIQLWEMIGNDDQYRVGQWIDQVEALNSDYEAIDGQEFPKGESAMLAQSQPAANMGIGLQTVPVTAQVPQAPAAQDAFTEVPF